jgi:protocatechuate 3,4-dioxygenase beta subunit
MDNDDQPIGRILTRREVLTLFGAAASAALLAACAPQSSPATIIPTQTPAAIPTTGGAATAAPASTATSAPAIGVPTAAATAAATTVASLPACIVRPALTEGPYFVDEKLNRSDIRSDPSDNSVKAGVPLALTVRVAKVSGTSCTPLAGATVDVWHCDALGVYSDASDPTFGSTKGKKFLRGYQTTDANGVAKFTTIYPGWYQGRAVHIHFKIRSKTSAGAAYDFTSQWFFDESLMPEIYAQAPYLIKGTKGRTTNAQDGIYQGGGQQLLLALTKDGQGYASTFDIGVQIA